MEKIREAQDKFVDGISRVSELMGFSDAMGRIYGLLYMSALPLSLDDICERLGLTKGTVSLYLKQLEERDIIRRVKVRNSRKKFYELRPDFDKVIHGIFRERLKKKMEIIQSTLDETIELVEEIFPELDANERNRADLIYHRLTVFKDFSLHVFKLMEYLHGDDKKEDIIDKIKRIEIR